MARAWRRFRSSGLAEPIGPVPQDEVFRKMRSAAFRVIPSLCYESFPRSLVEAFACGLPVIASRLGSLAELVDDGRTGILFNPGDVTDLADKLEWARANPAAMARMGDAARAEYERKYTPANNYDRLIAIYRDAIDEVRRREL